MAKDRQSSCLLSCYHLERTLNSLTLLLFLLLLYIATDGFDVSVVTLLEWRQITAQQEEEEE